MSETTMTTVNEKVDGSDAEWRTRDMSLAAYLACLGHEYVRMEHDADSCYWVYIETEAMPDEVFLFLEGKATVEPNAFNSKFSGLKRAMFRYERDHDVSFGRRS